MEREMKRWVKENWPFIFGGFVLICIIVIIILDPPQESLLKALGRTLGNIFGDVVEGFKEAMKK